MYLFGLVARPWSTERWGHSPPFSLKYRHRILCNSLLHNFDGVLIDYFVLLETAGWYRLVLSGGNYLLIKKRLAIFESYATITTP